MSYAPIFYRVTDDSSGSKLGDHGFLASEPIYQPRMFPPWSEQEQEDLKRMLDKHLNWYNREPTPFISVYISKKVAWDYAEARKNDGWTGVSVTYIQREMIGPECLRRVRTLAKDLGYWIPPRAWPNSEFEWIILNHIPQEAISDHLYMDDQY